MRRRCPTAVVLVLVLAVTGCSASGQPDVAATTGPHGSATHTATAMAHGSLISRVIPGTASGFHARAALIYLPPILTRDPHTRLPVLELFHGEPGSPSHWVSRGGLRPTLDAFAAAHHGRAPIVVLPDVNGSPTGDSECVSTSSGNVETYLTTDVQDYVRAHFTTDARRWSIAGISEGGTCAIMLALRHHERFALFGDMSGLTRPTLGPTDDPARTIKGLFDGSTSKYDQHDPTYLMRHHDYPSLTGYFVNGSDDARGAAAQSALVTLARGAGITLTRTTLPGGHTWRVWRAALPLFLPLVWKSAGLD